MRNMKAGRKNIVIKLGKVKVTKKILMDVEKIIHKRIKPTDNWVTIDKSKGFFGNEMPYYVWAGQVPNDVNTLWVSVNTKARSVSVKFTPRNTTINVQRIYSRDDELVALNKIAEQLEKYIGVST